MHKFSVVIFPDAESDWLVAYSPETGTASQGKTPAKALANLKEATGLYLQEFPMPKKRRTVLTAFTLKTAQA